VVQVYRSGTVFQSYMYYIGVQGYSISSEVQWIKEYYRCTGIVQGYKNSTLIQE